MIELVEVCVNDGGLILDFSVSPCLRNNQELVHRAERTQHFTITEVDWFLAFNEIIAVYCENHKKCLNKKCRITDF
jgi:hypothetical protein